MKTRQFRDLKVWQKGMELAQQIYHVTQTFPKQETFGLTAQMRRAAVSIPSNIAEGHGRTSDRGFMVFLGHARGSLFEVETQIELAGSLEFLSKKSADKLLSDCAEMGRMLNGLMNTVRNENDSNS